MKTTTRLLFACLIPVTLVYHPARAVDMTWTGRGTNAYWSIRNNWSTFTVPGAVDELGFGSGGLLLRSTNDLAPYLFLRSFDISEPGYFLTGNPAKVFSIWAHYSDGTSTVDMDLRPLDTYPGGLYITNNRSGTLLNLSGNVDSPDRPVAVYCTGTVNMSGVISGTAQLGKGFGGRLRLTGPGANTFGGEVRVRQGVLELSKSLSFPNGIRVGVTSVPCNLSIGDWGGAAIGSIAVLGFHNQIADTADVEVNQTGQLELDGYNEKINSLRMLGGVVTTGGGVLTLGDDLAAYMEANSRILGELDLGTGASRRLCITNPADLKLYANVSGPAGLTLYKVGDGDLLLAGTNTYEGPTVIQQGSVTLGSEKALGGAAIGTTLRTGTKLVLDGVSVWSESLWVDNSASLQATEDSNWVGPVRVDSTLFASAASGRKLTINGLLSGAGGLVVSNVGTIRITGAERNTIAGDFRVNSGTLELGMIPGVAALNGDLFIGDGDGGPERDVVKYFNSGQFAAETRVIIAASGLLSLNGFDAPLRWLSGSGALSLGSASLVLSNTTAHEYAGAIRGSGGIVKSGSGAWTLSGTNSYSGETVVEAGTLVVNGALSASSAVRVRSGATLAGSGAVQALALESGSKITPGNSVGTLTVNGALSMTGATYQVELLLGGTSPASDSIITLAGPNLSGGKLTLAFSGTVPLGSVFRIVDNQSAQPVLGVFNGLAEGAYITASGNLFQVSYVGGTGNDVTLTVVHAPASTMAVPTWVPFGKLQIQGQGLPGLTYQLFTSTNLMPGSWVFLQNMTTDPLGIYRYVEPAPVLPQRFYRVQSP